jgi:thiol-disulfide isomerase/thioredoxin
MLAPPWTTTEWLNTEAPLSLEALKGKVILLHAFQMLCPGCVSGGTPQAQRVAQAFPRVAVVGIHTVFEHHAAMTAVSLRAFVHEYRIAFPIGIDAPADDGTPIPQTMRAYGMRGTPTTILIDAKGEIRTHHFGVHEDLLLGAELQQLLMEAEDLS